MLDDLSTLRFTLFSALIGFGVFCCSYAFVVWNRRNTTIDKARGRAYQWASFLRRVTALGVVGGATAVAISWAVRETVRPEGKLNGEELFAIRARDNLRLESLAEGEIVQAGETLATFSSATSTAEIEELRFQAERLRAERQALELEPLKLDAELVRQHEDAITDRRQLRDSLQHLIPAREEIVRESLQNRLKRQEEIAELQVELDWYRGETEQSAARKKFNQTQLDRENELAAAGNAIPREVDAWARETKVYEVDVAKMADKVRDLESQQEQLRRGITEATTLATTQTATLDASIRDIRQQLAAVNELEQQLRSRLQTDEQRAREHRSQKVRELDLKVAESEAKRRGILASLVIRAPFAGRVVYRSKSPGAVYEKGPLIVLGPRDGYRMRLRLPESQLAAFQAAKPLLIQMDYSHQERLVEAQYHSVERMPCEPSYVLAELACVLPHETAWILAEGKEVRARLLWQPPIHTLWPFQAGAAIAVLSLSVWLFSWPLQSGGHRAAKQRNSAAPARAPAAIVAPVVSSPVPSAASTTLAPNTPHPQHVELGSAGALLTMLGSRLRTAIDAGRVESELLGAVEWALDRHQQRAIRLLSEALGHDTQLLQKVVANTPLQPNRDRLECILRTLIHDRDAVRI